jgi:hypothetical protein
MTEQCHSVDLAQVGLCHTGNPDLLAGPAKHDGVYRTRFGSEVDTPLL